MHQEVSGMPSLLAEKARRWLRTGAGPRVLYPLCRSSRRASRLAKPTVSACRSAAMSPVVATKHLLLHWACRSKAPHHLAHAVW